MRFGPELAARRGEAGEGMQRLAHAVDAEIDEMALHVRPRVAGQRRPEEPAGISGADGQRTLALQQVAHADTELAVQGAQVVVEGDRSRAFEDDADLQVILVGAAHPFMREHHRHLEALEQIARSDARQLQQRRGCDRTG
jgi:hypothetical protein